jgi:hypothetical protein
MEAIAHDDSSIPEDDPVLVALMNRAARSLQEAGLTSQDLLDELPLAQEELLREDLGDEFVDSLLRLHASLHHE